MLRNRVAASSDGQKVKSVMSRLGPIAKLAALAVVLLGAVQGATAHYLWIESRQTQDWVEARSGFGHPDDWDAEMADRIETARYWVVSPSGELQPLDLPKDKARGDYGTKTPQRGPAAIVGSSDGGVTTGPDGKKTLTRYFAKRMVGAPDDWSRIPGAQPLDLEIVPRLGPDGVDLAVMAGSNPATDIPVKVYMPDGRIMKSKSDSEGLVHLGKAQPGNYSVLAHREREESGEAKSGLRYDRVQEYSTLSFTLTESGPTRTPL